MPLPQPHLDEMPSIRPPHEAFEYARHFSTVHYTPPSFIGLRYDARTKIFYAEMSTPFSGEVMCNAPGNGFYPTHRETDAHIRLESEHSFGANSMVTKTVRMARDLMEKGILHADLFMDRHESFGAYKDRLKTASNQPPLDLFDPKVIKALYEAHQPSVWQKFLALTPFGSRTPH